MKNTFSVIIPTHNRPEKILRAVNAVLNQTYQEFELIVIDDGSNPMPEAIYKIRNPKLIIIRQSIRHHKLIARNLGMKASRNDWICCGDDDDYHRPTYLEEFNDAINGKGSNINPNLAVWQCAAEFYKMVNGKNTKIRTLKPMEFYEDKRFEHLDDDLGLHPHFPSGRITMGMFIFHRDCLKTIGYFPHVWTPGDFAIAAKIPGYGMLPPQPPRFPKERCQVMGNPFGDDYYLFYKLARHFEVGSIHKPLYVKECR